MFSLSFETKVNPYAAAKVFDKNRKENKSSNFVHAELGKMQPKHWSKGSNRVVTKGVQKSSCLPGSCSSFSRSGTSSYVTRLQHSKGAKIFINYKKQMCFQIEKEVFLL